MAGVQVPEVEIDEVGLSWCLTLERDTAVIRTPAPRPPGTRLTLRRPGEERALAQGKVVSVKVEGGDPPRWDLKLKLFSPGREVRGYLAGGPR